MKVVITGASGQLGRALQASAPECVQVVPWTRDQLDISDRARALGRLRETAPDLVINAAAFTAVDRAESAPETAHAVNATGVANLSHAASVIGARFVQISTDHVFDGKWGSPYPTDAPVAPVNRYGLSKSAGEQAAGRDSLIVRTSWVYAREGNNFVRTILRLLDERDHVHVVADQIGSPTYAPSLAATIWALSGLGVTGIYHVTDNGVASWYDFAVAIQEEALALGRVSARATVIPVSTSDYPTAARRPACCILDNAQTWRTLNTVGAHWRANLRLMLREAGGHG